MIRKIKYISGISVFILSFFLFTKVAAASEGTVELKSTNGKDNRCFAASLLMPNASYNIIVSCRDLIYPPQADLFTYLMWATPIDGGNPIKFGELGIGKASFTTKDAFSDLFVTTERNRNARRPEGEVVMKGNIQSISFLDKPRATTPTSTVTPEVTEQAQLTTGQKLSLALKRAGLVILLALAATVGLVFILTRPKR